MLDLIKYQDKTNWQLFYQMEIIEKKKEKNFYFVITGFIEISVIVRGRIYKYGFYIYVYIVISMCYME